MTTLTLVGDTAPGAPTMQTLPPLRRRVYLAAVCALRVLQTGRTWQHDRLDGYREGVTAGINYSAASLEADYGITAPPPALQPRLTLITGEAS